MEITKTVAHLDLDTFFVSCERLNNNKLDGLPLIIGGSSSRGVVASCSYEARYYGVRSAMPMRMALKLCPDARVIKGDMELYSKKSKEVTEVLKEDSPILEKSSIDEFYLDVSGMDRFFGCYQFVDELTNKAMIQTGLPLSFGLSVNKTVAKMATTESKPLGKLQVQEPNVKPFLFPMSIKKIPMLGDKTYQFLSRIGVRKIKTLAEMPMEMMEKLMGKNGVTLWKKANGIDNSPIVPYMERKSISKEQTFHSDTMDIPGIKALAVAMVEELAFQLRKDQKLASVVTVKIRYSNFDTHTVQKRLAYTSSDHTLIKAVLELFDKLYERRMLIRLLGVRLSGLVNGTYQINLFDDTITSIQLYQAMDKMKSRYGKSAIMRASSFDAISKYNS